MSGENKTAAKIFNYCPSCGTKTGRGVQICPGCTKTIGDSQYDGIPRIGAAGFGYSEITEHESFAAYNKSKKKIVTIAIPLIVLVLTIILSVIFGPAVGIVTGLFLLILMVIIALVQLRNKPSWEGTVVKKEHVHIKREGADRNTYTVKFNCADGKNRKQVWHSHSFIYDYLQEGDRVRYLGSISGDNAFEKYDKSQDESIPCACCGLAMDPRYTYCTICGALLLKGKAAQ